MAFVKKGPDWISNVKFACVMEATCDTNLLGITKNHPGIAMAQPSMHLRKVLARKNSFRVEIQIDEDHRLHASLEPETLDPNEVLLRTLLNLRDIGVASFENDRDISKGLIRLLCLHAPK